MGVLLCQSILTALIALFVGVRAWDDGAITLAFAKTFAESGRIALTPVSEQVEGFSSVAWLFINALISLLHPGFRATILAAQAATGLFLGAATIVLWFLARKLKLRLSTALAVVFVFSFFGPSISEIANGMEMTLLTASGLALVYSIYFEKNRFVIALSLVLFLTARFEAMFYYAALLLPLAARKQYARFVLLAIAGLAVAGVQEVWRYVVFGDFIPNTIRAKMHEPYRFGGMKGMESRFYAVMEPFEVILIFVVALSTLWLVATKNQRAQARSAIQSRGGVDVLVAPVIGVVLFSAMAGQNWGYTGRMQYLAFPFLLLLCGIMYEDLSKSMAVAKTNAALVSLSIALVLFSWPLSARGPFHEIGWFLRERGNPGWERFNVTPDSYRRTGLTVDKLRSMTGKSQIVFMAPDVGGLALCCRRIRIVDVGLLTNRKMAREGYGAFPDVLAQERPDIIEIHKEWAITSGIYGLSLFRNEYQPVVMEGARFYVRNDIVDSLVRLGKARTCSIEEARCLLAGLELHRYAGFVFRNDDVAFLRRGAFVEVLN